MRALFELDFRCARNQALRALRSPWRVAVLVPYVVLVTALLLRRLLGASHAAAIGAGNTEAFATLAGGACMTVFGFALARHAGGRVQAFRAPAEPIFLAGSGLSQPVFSAWLQLRNLAGALLRWFGTIALYLGAFAPPSASRDELLRAALAIVLLTLGLGALEFPAFALGRARFGGIAVAAGWATCTVGAVVSLAAASALLGDPDALGRVYVALGFDPGDGVRAVLQGGMGLAALAAFPLAVSLAYVAFARDQLAALYETTAHAASAQRRLNEVSATAQAPGDHIPSGLATLLWKEWIALRRGGGFVRIVAGFVAWCALGSLVAFAFRSRDAGLLAALTTAVTLAVALLPLAEAAGALDELRGTLWWTAPSSTFARLAAWSFSRGWAGGVALCGLPLALGIWVRDPGIALAGPPMAVLTWCSLTAFALASQTIAPGRFDLRGPFGALRLAVALAFLMPPCSAFALTVNASGNVLAGAFAATLTIAALASLALFAAAQRIALTGVGSLRAD